MKKVYYSLLIIPLLMSSCGTKDEYKILTPTGSPALAFYNFSNYRAFETNSVPSNVISAISNSSSYALVVAPTIGGIQAINRTRQEQGHSSFKIASTITFGNFYLASTGNDTNSTLDDEDSVVLFSQSDLPDKLFQNVYADLYSSLTSKNHIHYVKSASNAASALISGSIPGESGGMMNVDYVLVAEPGLSGALKKNPKGSIYSDIQKLYQKKSPNHQIMQASIFVNCNFKKDNLNSLLKKIETDVQNGINNPSSITEGLNKFPSDQVTTIFGIPSISLIEEIMKDGNRLNINYKNAYENKNSIDLFINDIAPSIGVTNEEIYFK